MRARLTATSVGLLAGALFLAVPRSYADEKTEKVEAKGKEAKKAFQVTEKLTKDDPRDTRRTQSYAKVHSYKMKAGQAYKIEMISKEDNPKVLDPYLRLEDPDGREVAQDDDGAGFPNARIVYQAEKDGTYKVICTTYVPNQTGKYILTIAEAKLSAVDLLLGRVKNIGEAEPPEQQKTFEAVKKLLESKKGDLTIKEAMLGFQTAQGLDFSGNTKLAARAYESMGQILAGASDKKLADAAKSFEGAVRRLKLPGHPIEVKGKTLDGKELDWKAYRGKIVLVDFWATWCGPCIAELPNVKKLYKTYHQRGFDVVGISLDRNNDAPEEFIKDKKLPWVCIGPESGGQDLAKYYGVMAIPLPILVDREGRVVSMRARGEELQRLLEKHIGPAESPGAKTKEKVD